MKRVLSVLLVSLLVLGPVGRIYSQCPEKGCDGSGLNKELAKETAILYQKYQEVTPLELNQYVVFLSQRMAWYATMAFRYAHIIKKYKISEDQLEQEKQDDLRSYMILLDSFSKELDELSKKYTCSASTETPKCLGELSLDKNFLANLYRDLVKLDQKYGQSVLIKYKESAVFENMKEFHRIVLKLNEFLGRLQRLYDKCNPKK